MLKKETVGSISSPLGRWFSANRENPGLGDSLRLLLGHALVDIFRRNCPDFPVFSPERALSIAQRLPRGCFPASLGDWLSNPVGNADGIIRFCEACENFRLPAGIEFSGISRGVADLRNVRCPLGAVRARLVLSGMDPGEEVTLLLSDGEPVENVPRAMVEDGNEILSREKKGNYWRISIRKRKITV